jgi:RND family efflux transporter MFP subunit
LAPQPDSASVSAPLDAWLAHICGLVPGVSQALVVTRGADDGPWKPAAAWPLDARGSDALLEAAQLAAESGRPVLRSGAPDASRHDVAAPLEDLVAGQEGAVAIAVADAAQETLLAALRTVQSGIAWLPFVSRSGRQAVAPALARIALDLVATAHDHARFQAAATAVVTELATRLGCERVSLGLVERGRLRLCAVSHSARFDERSKVLRDVIAAMEEAIDQEALVIDPPPPGAEPVLRRAHEALRGRGAGGVCSVPVAAHGSVTGALTLELPPGRELDADIAPALLPLGGLVVPILASKRREERFVGAKVWDAARSQAAALAEPGHPGRRLVACVALAFGLLLAVVPATHRVAAPAHLEGTVQRAVVAAMEGYVAESRARAGDVVRKGQILGVLDGSQLDLERRKWMGRRAQYVKEHRAARAGHELGKMSVEQARIDQADAEIALIDELLARTRLVAPFDGIVARGDLSQSLGSPVARGEVLFEIAPLDRYRIILEVDERDIAHVRVGLSGELALSALPTRTFPLVVERVTPVATADEARNFFRVESRLDGPIPTLRPGMEGIAKIEAGERSLLWIWTHSLFDWLRLWAWARIL